MVKMRGSAKVEIKTMEPCKHKRTLIQLQIPEAWDLHVHEECANNELIAVRNRVVMDVPRPSPAMMQMLESVCEDMASKLRCKYQADMENTIKTFPQCRRKLYSQQRTTWQDGSLLPKHTFIRSFVKCEKLQLMKKDVDPRLIQARSPYFNMILATWTKPIEKELYNLKWVNGLRCITKGLNLDEKAQLLVSHWRTFQDPVGISCDLSRWDAHVSVEMIKIAHKFYQKLIPDSLFQNLLENQIINKARTKNGVRYTTAGGVMSGDMTTALGNCVLVIMCLRLLYEMTGIQFAIVDDGDDHVLMCERKDYSQLTNMLPEFWRGLGHEMRVDGIAETINQVVFCQHKPMLLQGSWTMVPDPRKVLATAFSATGSMTRQPMLQKYMGTLWEARAILHRGVPLLGTLFENQATWNKERLSKKGTLFRTLESLGKDLKPRKNNLVTPEEIAQFAEMWEISVDRIRSLQEIRCSWTPSVIQETENKLCTWI